MALLLLACIQDQAEGDARTPRDTDAADDTGETGEPERDEVSATLSSTSDLCAWDDGVMAEAEPVVVPEGYLDVESAYQPCLDASFQVDRRVLDYTLGHEDASEAFATFFTVTTVDEEFITGEWLDPMDGIDDCGVLMQGHDGLFREGDLVWLDPGGVALTTATASTALDRQEGGTVLNWQSDLTAAGSPAAYGDSFGLSVLGSSGSGDWAGFDGIELPDLVTLPAELNLAGPYAFGNGVVMERADLPLTWSGSSANPVSIEIWGIAGGGSGNEYMVTCSVTDDGAFTIPAAVLEELPAIHGVTLTVSRTDETWVGTREGRSVRSVGRVDYSAWEMAFP